MIVFGPIVGSGLIKLNDLTENALKLFKIDYILNFTYF